MAKFTEVVHKLVRPYYNYFIVALSLIIFASFGMLAYNRYYKTNSKRRRMLQMQTAEGKTSLYICSM